MNVKILNDNYFFVYNVYGISPKYYYKLQFP